jgi:hypothetical protein
MKKLKSFTLSFILAMVFTFPFKAEACYSVVCCNESCSETASCSGTVSCKADGNNGIVTCDGARSYCNEP